MTVRRRGRNESSTFTADVPRQPDSPLKVIGASSLGLDAPFFLVWNIPALHARAREAVKRCNQRQEE